MVISVGSEDVVGDACNTNEELVTWYGATPPPPWTIDTSVSTSLQVDFRVLTRLVIAVCCFSRR